jgi:hypothetical protein
LGGIAPLILKEGNMAEVIVKEGIEGVEFFGDVDKNKKGEIASHVPSWYLNQHKEELEGNIEYVEKQLANGVVYESEKPITVSNLKKMKEKLESIEASKPMFSDGQKDLIDKTRKSIGKKISEAMFTRSDMMKGLADAHEEARRMADPCIKLEGPELVLAQKAGCRIDGNGRVSRTSAEMVWKFSSRAIGEPSNTESLRKS